MSGPASPGCITVHVPMTFRKRGGRKQVIAPNGETWAPPRARIDSTIVKALARGFRWRRMLETGAVATVTEIAAKERINGSYVSRVLRLTLLAPEIVEAILDGRQATDVTLPVLMKVFPAEWSAQKRCLATAAAPPHDRSHDGDGFAIVHPDTAFAKYPGPGQARR